MGTTKKIISVALSITTAVWLSGAAMVAPVQAATTVELQAQIAALLAQIQQLQAQLGSITGTSTAVSSYNFTRSLTVGSKGADVKELQKFLNSQGFTVSSSGAAGSSGNETEYFGPATKAALIKFQAAKSILPAAGYFGPITRSVVASLGESTTTGTTTETTTGTTTTETTTTTTTTTVVGSGLTVTAATQPVAGLFPEGVASMPFTKLTFTASADGDVTVSSITVQRTGYANDAVFGGVIALDENGVRIGTSKTFNSDHTLKLSNSFVIKAGTSKTISIAGDSVADESSYQGQLVTLSVTAVDAGSTQVNGSFPITGAMLTVNHGLTIGSATLQRGVSDPNNGNLTVSKEVGITGYTFSALKVTAGSAEDLTMKSIQWNQAGSAASSDLANVKIYVEGTAYDTTVSSDGKYYSAVFSSGVTIGKGLSKEVTVKGDIIGGSGRTISFDLYRYADVQLIGNVYSYGILPSATEAAASSNDGNFHAAQPNFDAGGINISNGTITISKSSNSVGAAGNIAINLSDQPLGAFDIEVKGEQVSVARTVFHAFISATAVGTNIDNIKLLDANGNVVAGPVDATGSTADATITFTDTVTYPIGKNTYRLVGKLDTTFVNDITVTASTTPSTNWTTVKGLTTGNTISLAAQATAVTGNTMTVKGAALSVSVSPSPTGKTVVRGITGFTFANYILSASASGEDIKVTSITPSLGVLGTVSSLNTLTNCQFFDGTTPLNTGSNVYSPASSAVVGVLPTITFDSGLTITKGTTKTLALKCDIAAGGTATTIAFGLIATAGNVVSTGLSSGQDVTETLTAGNGGTMTMAGQGTLAIALDSSSASLKMVNAATADNIASVLRLTAANEDVTVNQIILKLAGNASNTPQDVTKVSVWLPGGTSSVGDGVFVTNGLNDAATITLSNVVVPANSDLTLTLKVSIASIGIGNDAKSGHIIKVDWESSDKDTSGNSNTRGIGASSGTAVYATGSDTASQGLVIYKAIPTLSKVAVSSNVLTDGTKILYRFSVAAPTQGAIGLYKFSFNVATSQGASTLMRVTNFQLYQYSDSGFSQAVQGGLMNSSGLTTTDDQAIGSGATKLVEVYFNPVVGSGTTKEAIQVSAGQTRYFELKASVLNSTGTASIVTALAGDAAGYYSYAPDSSGSYDDFTSDMYGYATSAAMVNASEDNNFIWSDNATTTSGVATWDWVNGYAVPNLPSTELQSETLSK